MKKKSIFIVAFMLVVSILYSQSFEKPFKFYVIDVDEMGAIFQEAMPFFASITEGKKIDKVQVDNFVHFAYSNEKAQYDMTKCFLKAHFRHSRNKEVQKIVKSKFNKLIPKAESEAINAKYNSKIEKLANGNIKYVYKNLSDEDIFFDRFISFNDMDKRVTVYAPSANFKGSVSFSSSPKKEVYMTEGQSAVLKIKILKEKYKNLPKKVSSSKKCIRYDISNYGFMKHNNSEKTVLEFLENREDLFIFRLNFYDEDTKTIYTLHYEYMISPANMNYKIFDQLKKHLLYHSFFSYINN